MPLKEVGTFSREPNKCVRGHRTRWRPGWRLTMQKAEWPFQVYICQPHATWPIYQSGLKLGYDSSKLKFCLFLISVFIHLRKIFYSGKKYFWDKTMLSFKIVPFAESTRLRIHAGMHACITYSWPLYCTLPSTLYDYTHSFVVSCKSSPHFKVKQIQSSIYLFKKYSLST